MYMKYIINDILRLLTKWNFGKILIEIKLRLFLLDIDHYNMLFVNSHDHN